MCAECQTGDSALCMSVFLSTLGIGPMQTPRGGFAPAIERLLANEREVQVLVDPRRV